MNKRYTILIILVILILGAGIVWRIKTQKNNKQSIVEYKSGEEQTESRLVPPPQVAKLDRPINVGIVTWGGYAGGIMANNGFKANKNCDFYRNHDIQVEIKVIDDYVQSRSAFKAGGDKGGVDIVWGTVDAYALEYPAMRVINPVCIMQYDWSRGGDAIAIDGRIIRTPADLKGKTVSVAEETPSHYFALFVLEEAGLHHRDIKWRFTNSAIDAANVFKAGRTDATVSWSPDVYIAARERTGGKILMSTREATHLIADIFIARGDFAEKYPDAVRSFVHGWLDGVDKVHHNNKQVIRLMAEGFNLSLEDSEAMLGDVHLPNYADNMEFFDSFNPVGYDAIFQKASKLWKDLGKIEVVHNAKESRNTRYLLEIAEYFKGQEPADPFSTEKFKKVFKPEEKETAKEVIAKRVTINFETGKYELDSEAKSVIHTKIAQFVATYGGCFINIEGNTDNVGSYELNKWLSEKRASSVEKFLISEYKMAPERFSVKGNAWDKPIADNTTPVGRAQNRRTDIIVKCAGM